MSYNVHNFEQGGLIRAADINQMDYQIFYNSEHVNNADVRIGELEDSVGALESAIPFVLQTSTRTAVDGYSDLNTRDSEPENSPYFLERTKYSYGNEKLIGMKLKVNVPGTLSIGYTLSSLVAVGASTDSSSVTVKEVINVSTAGTHDITFENPFLIPDDCTLTIGINTDTLKFAFEKGNEKGFLYYSDVTNTIRSSQNSLGLSFYTEYVSSAVYKVKSVYNGKSLSVLGDSISTFEGYIPAENATYYPRETVSSVDRTWWHKLITALGMNISVNNSWSGSRVTGTGASAGSGARCQNLGNPDVIIVYMGINDFNNEVPLGTYNGKSALPTSQSTFREAYAVMLNKILTKYKRAEVYCCTLVQCERNGSEGFPEINDAGVALETYNEAIRELASAFGLKVLEHSKCGLTYQNMSIYNTDKLHMNADGHSLIANNDISQLDGSVRVRY